MPIYEYACGACHTRFDRLQKMSDPDPTRCDRCGVEGAVRRQLSAPQFRLAGAGWYETDFKSDKDQKRNLSGDGGAPAEAKATEKKDSAPAEASKSATPVAPES
jgi:putative FmdB family regulatory protein